MHVVRCGELGGNAAWARQPHSTSSLSNAASSCSKRAVQPDKQLCSCAYGSTLCDAEHSSTQHALPHPALRLSWNKKAGSGSSRARASS